MEIAMPLLAIEIEWRMLAGGICNLVRGTLSFGFFLTCSLVCCIGYAIHLFAAVLVMLHITLARPALTTHFSS